MESISTEKWIEEKLRAVPSKYSFRIGEVSKMLSIKSYILRYWESEFDQLKPKKLDNKQRLYLHKDIKTLLLIKKLLYEDGYSIRGAKQALKGLSKQFKHLEKKVESQKNFSEEIDSVMAQVSQLIFSLEKEKY